MTDRIERLADEYDWTLDGERDWNSERPEEIKSQCFSAGYRRALADMQSEQAMKAWGDFVRGHIAHTCSVPTAAEIMAALAKELGHG